MIVEYCLIPKSIVDKHVLKDNDKNINEKEIKIKRTEITKLPYKSPNEYRHSLDEQIKKSVSKKNIDKTISLYNWLLENVQGLEYLKNGQLLSPISDLNLIDFFKDIYSNKKNIPEEKINIYRLFTSIISLPAYFIDNKFIKSKIYPNYDNNDNNNNDNNAANSRKRKLQSPSPINVSKKIRKKIKHRDSNKFDNSDDDIEFIEKSYDKHVETPIKRNLRERIPKKGASKMITNFVTIKKPSLNKKSWIQNKKSWIHY